MFFCEFYEVSQDTFSYRTLLVAASEYCLDKQGIAGAWLTYLSKALDRINSLLNSMRMVFLLKRLNLCWNAWNAWSSIKLFIRQMSKIQDQCNFLFLDSVTLRSSARISRWSHTVQYLHQWYIFCISNSLLLRFRLKISSRDVRARFWDVRARFWDVRARFWVRYCLLWNKIYETDTGKCRLLISGDKKELE